MSLLDKRLSMKDTTKSPYYTCYHCGTITWSLAASTLHMCSWKEAAIKEDADREKLAERIKLLEEANEILGDIYLKPSGDRILLWRAKYKELSNEHTKAHETT